MDNAAKVAWNTVTEKAGDMAIKAGDTIEGTWNEGKNMVVSLVKSHLPRG